MIHMRLPVSGSLDVLRCCPLLVQVVEVSPCRHVHDDAEHHLKAPVAFAPFDNADFPGFPSVSLELFGLLVFIRPGRVVSYQERDCRRNAHEHEAQGANHIYCLRRRGGESVVPQKLHLLDNFQRNSRLDPVD